MTPTLPLLAAFAATAVLAAPQAPPPAPPDATPVVDELIVRAYDGPPWWVVSDGDSKAYVFATPGPLPPGVTFDKSQLERRLTGARLLITPTTNGGLPLLSLAKVRKVAKEINGGGKSVLQSSVSPAIYARFARLRDKAGLPASRYDSLPPGLAAMALAGDLRLAKSKANPTRPGTTYPVSDVMKAARAKRVKTRPAHVYRNFDAFIREIRMPGLACMTSTLDMIERRAQTPEQDRAWQGRQDAAARAWAQGDIRPLMDLIRQDPPQVGAAIQLDTTAGELALLAATPECLDAMPTQAKVRREWIGYNVAPITEAMAKPGHIVVVLNADILLARGGVLDRLQRQGFTVTTPDGAGRL